MIPGRWFVGDTPYAKERQRAEYRLPAWGSCPRPSRDWAGVDGPNNWCNPARSSLGHRPAVATDIPLLDAYLWIKRPRESDGVCNNDPPAGQWWPDHALGLAQRAALDNPVACFPTVALCADGQFSRYWRENGGLALNGYPVSGVLTATLEGGTRYRVQYFERTRFEYHRRMSGRRTRCCLASSVGSATPSRCRSPDATLTRLW